VHSTNACRQAVKQNHVKPLEGKLDYESGIVRTRKQCGETGLGFR
jgi:hypothetical protein